LHGCGSSITASGLTSSERKHAGGAPCFTGSQPLHGTVRSGSRSIPFKGPAGPMTLNHYQKNHPPNKLARCQARCCCLRRSGSCPLMHVHGRTRVEDCPGWAQSIWAHWGSGARLRSTQRWPPLPHSLATSAVTGATANNNPSVPLCLMENCPMYEHGYTYTYHRW